MLNRLTNMVGAVVVPALRLPKAIANANRRGFHVASTEKADWLRWVGEVFLLGYNHALDATPESVAAMADTVLEEDRGFVFEGAAMAYAVTDALGLFGGRRLPGLISGTGAPHLYMVHVGAGWAMAKIPWLRSGFLQRFDPMLVNLVADGWGFADTYLGGGRSWRGDCNPCRGTGLSTAYDQGAGRALWFVAGADPDLLAALIDARPQTRHGDLWAGAGLAVAYTGAAGDSDLVRLCQLARSNLPALAQGSAFAVEARNRAGNPSRHTDVACRILTGLAPPRVLDLVAAARAKAEGAQISDTPGARYETWRRYLQDDLSAAEREAA